MLIPINGIILIKGLMERVKILSVHGSFVVRILSETMSVLFHRLTNHRRLTVLSLLSCSWLSSTNPALYYASTIRLVPLSIYCR